MTVVPQYSVLGVPVTDATMDEALAILDAMISAQPPRSHSVYFVNAQTLNLACDDSGFRGVLRAADRVFGYGAGVRWATRMLHAHRLRDNVKGTDLVLFWVPSVMTILCGVEVGPLASCEPAEDAPCDRCG